MFCKANLKALSDSPGDAHDFGLNGRATKTMIITREVLKKNR